MNRRHFLQHSAVAFSFTLAAPLIVRAQTPPKQATPSTEFKPLRGGVGLFTGQGGTIGWLVNKDAVVVVDTQFPTTAALCLSGLPGRDDRKIDCVINTHHHGDHTGGNSVFKPVAKMMVAHENVPRLQREAAQRSAQPGKAAAEPVCADTVFKDTWRMAAGDEVVSARYHGPAHTSGDAIILFEKANVVHMGDLVFNRLYPVVDRPAGARFQGWIKVLEEAAKAYPKDAIYIFGHGKAPFGVSGSPQDLLTFRDYISALLAHVEKEVRAGKTKEEIAKLENLPGFPDLHQPAPSRLKGNLETAYEELTTKS